ncbi:uncharacterized protein [Misgurnus anguillicaudatus]
MVRENEINVTTAKTIKQLQTMSSHYTDTGYDRGHLNPNCFGRDATFTLTNAVPMDTCFNRLHWKNWEIRLKSFLKDRLNSHGGWATVYIVTGAVPDENVRIPQREISEDPERVTVPSHIWTAVCYKHLYDNEKSFSFGYIGKNQPSQPDINLMSISNLNDQLSELYGQLSYKRIRVFDEDCFGDESDDNNKLNLVYEGFKNLITMAVSNVVEVRTDIQNKYNAVKRTVNSEGNSLKRVKVKEMTVKLGFGSMSAFYTVVEDLKVFAESTCLITFAKPRTPVNGELRKRDVSVVSDAVECLLVSEKQMTAADGSQCSSIPGSEYTCFCDAGGEKKPCCSSPCLYQKKLNSYRCYSGQTLIECSPRYSLITIKGERCMDDYPCATYGNDYYWCKTKDGYLYGYTWEYCSPPLWRSKAKNGKYCHSNHACAKYGKNYRWCYTDDKNNDKCCISEDCYSTVTEKRCRSDHPCGYHGYDYLWCYTDDKDNYDYCCTNCA